MQYFDPELQAAIERRLDRARIPSAQHADYHKWFGLYLRFCQQSGYAPTVPTALGPFLTQLAGKGHSIDERHQAGLAVRLLLRPDPQDPSLYRKLSAPAPEDNQLRAPAHSPPGTPATRSPPPASWERVQCFNLEA